MKKILYLLVGIELLFFAVSCEEKAKNPGDFNLKAELTMDNQLISTLGESFELKAFNTIDSTYRYSAYKNDTLKDSEGKPIIGPDGKLVITIDTIYYYSKITAKFIEMDTINLPAKADTFTIKLKSNARWRAPVPSPGDKAQWFYNYNILTGGTSISGGGDGVLQFRVSRNRNKKRPLDAVQYIYTNDSTIMYRLVFSQAGERD